MNKKILLAIFGGLAGVGVLLMLVGFAMGGRPGSIGVDDNGDMVYVNPREEVCLERKAPRFWYRMDSLMGGRFGRHHGMRSRTQTQGTSGTQRKTATDWHDLELPAGCEAAHGVDVDVSAGYVTVKPGDELRVQARGPLNSNIYLDEGICKIKADYDDDAVQPSADDWEQNPRLMDGKRDITTEYIITVPPHHTKLEVDVEVGALNVSEMDLDKGEFAVERGRMHLKDCVVADSEIETDSGDVQMRNFRGTNCHFDVDGGNVDFDGDITGVFGAECEYGNIVARVPRHDGYGWTTNAGQGSVQIGGQHHSRLGRSGHHGAQGTTHGTHGTHGQGGHGVRQQDRARDLSCDGVCPHYNLSCKRGNIDIIFND